MKQVQWGDPRNGHRQKKRSVATGVVQESDVAQEHILEEVPRADGKKPKQIKKGTQWAGGIFLRRRGDLTQAQTIKALQTLNAEERKDATCATAVTLSDERSSKNDNKQGEPKRRGDDIQQGDSGPIWAATGLQLCCNSAATVLQLEKRSVRTKLA